MFMIMYIECVYIVLPFIPNFGVVFHISLHKISNLKI